jgi:hypothetical protein
MAHAWIGRGWLRRVAATGEGDILARRRLSLTPEGARGLHESLGIDAA